LQGVVVLVPLVEVEAQEVIELLLELLAVAGLLNLRLQ
jgi:hypothetical protein